MSASDGLLRFARKGCSPRPEHEEDYGLRPITIGDADAPGLRGGYDLYEQLANRWRTQEQQ